LDPPFESERRANPRVAHPFPVTLRTTGIGGVLHIETVLDNVSARGLFVRLVRPIEPGASLSIGIRLWAADPQVAGARVSARGVVRRMERLGDGEYGIAVEFSRPRVIWPNRKRPLLEIEP
jgi:hypothetical protein